MRRSLPLLAWAVSLFLLASPAVAGPYSDDLAKCLVRSTTPEDKTLLVQWMFATMALQRELFAHPDVAAGNAELTRMLDAQKLEKALAAKR